MKTLFTMVCVVAMLTMAAGCGSSSNSKDPVTCDEAFTNYYNHSCSLAAINSAKQIVPIALTQAIAQCNATSALVTLANNPICSAGFDLLLACLAKATTCTECDSVGQAFADCTNQ